MRILEQKGERALTSVCLYLTEDEAVRLMGRLERLLANPAEHHTHFEDEDYKHEITVTIYRDDNMDSYDERSRTLILEDK